MYKIFLTLIFFVLSITIITACDIKKEEKELELKNYRISKKELPNWIVRYNLIPPGTGIFKKEKSIFLRSLEDQDYLLGFFHKGLISKKFKKIDEMRIQKSTVIQYQKRTPLKGLVEYEIITVDLQRLSRGVLIRFGRSIAKYDLDQDVL